MLSKELLSLTGEYAVASELCKRGIYAQLTLGHHKQTDILVETEYTMLRIQVKTKQRKEWPAIRGIYREDDFLVLVDLEGKEPIQRPDFYILNLDDWKRLIWEERERFPDIRIDNRFGVEYPDGWKGLNIKPQQIEDCLEAWEKIIKKVKKKTTLPNSGMRSCLAQLNSSLRSELHIST